MRHRKAGVKLNRTTSHRQAMFRNMVTSLFKYDRIRTTDAKAKELRRWADNMVTLAKRGDLHARRQALAVIREKAVVHKLFEEAPERYGDINGGYTRIVKLARRPGDAAPVSMIELVVAEKDKKKATKKPKAKDQATSPEKKESLPETPLAPIEEPAEVSEQSSSDTKASEAVEEDVAEDKEEMNTAPSEDSADSEIIEPEK
jgi:large subunit ribosomal protein L17